MDNKKLNLITELAQRLPVDGTKLTRKDVAYILTESQWKMCYKWLSEEAADYITADRSQLSVKDAKTKRALIAYLESVREAKTNKAIYRIRDVAAMLDVPISTLRFWEDTFPQFKPDRTPKGQRRYAPNDIEVAKLIKSLLRDKGYSLDFAKRRMNEIHGNYSYEVSCKSTEDAINSLVKFAKRETVDVLAMTSKFVQNWIDWIGEQPTPKGKSGGRAASLYFACLRAMYHRARKEFNDEERGIIRIPFSPFSKVDVPKPKPTRKRALTMEQLRAIASVERPDTWDNKRFNLSCDAFMLSFMLIGMNAADLYDAPASALDGERITYKRKKTRTRRDDEAEISVKVEPEVIHLVEKYRDPKGERLFRFCRLYSDPGTFNAALNKGLKQVGKALGIEDLEFYAARHSWATIATNEAGIDKYTVHEALNHVDPAMKVTDIYIKKNWSNIDKANRAVLDLVFGKK